MKKNKLNKIILILMIAIILVTVFLLYTSRKIKVTNIALNKEYVSLVIGEYEIIGYDILPNNATDKSIIWKSENPEIASITSDGIIEGKSKGNTLIIIQTEDGSVQTECVVQVLEKEVEKIELDRNSITLNKGDNISLVASITPNDLQDKKIIWVSDNTDIAKVDENGIVTGISNGVTTIKATIMDKTATCEVNVVTPVLSIELSKNDITLLKGASRELVFNLNPSDATNKEVTWSSSNHKIVTVDNGKIVAKASGTATITVTTNDGSKIATCQVRVLVAKEFDQRNNAVIEYLKSPSASKIQSTQKSMCSKDPCHRPNDYKTSLTGKIKVYQYNEKTNEEKLIVTTTSEQLNYYLVPNHTYYLESSNDKNKVEVVKITGDLRMITFPNIGNMRDLGGWSADGGKIKYGKIFRSANTNTLTTKEELNALGISKVVDLRANNEINHSSAVEGIRKAISITYYTNGKEVRNAIQEIMKSVVEQNKNVLFNCNLGRDRTGTIAYIIERLLGVSLNDRSIDYELTYYYSATRTRNDGVFKSFINKFNSYGMKQYEQERFINWYLSTSTNKEQDLQLINNFRKTMIDGTPHIYKLSNGTLTLS